MNSPMYFWLIAFVALGAVEAATAALTSIWFAVGALAAFVAAALGAGIWVQVVVFILASAAALAATRPLVRKFTAGRKEATNADRVIGQSVRVTEAIDNLAPSGAVYVDGKTWTARSSDGSFIREGAMVRVVSLKGVTLFVKEEEH